MFRLGPGILAAATLVGCNHANADSRRDPAAFDGGIAAALPSAKAAEAPSKEPTAPACATPCAAVERCDAGRCVPSCDAGEVYVPATGPEGFVMGRGAPGQLDQSHRVILTKPFCMDATEVTVAAYRACFDAGECTLPQLNDANSNFRPEFKRDAHPLNMVNWEQARHFCERAQKALPTEAQWEWAAGAGTRKYPWGDAPEPTCENRHADFTPGGAPKSDPAGDVGCHGGGSSPVKSHPLGAAKWPHGEIHDLAGNLWEWTADCFLPYPREAQTDPSPQRNEALAGECFVRALRGGGWNRSSQALTTYRRAGSKKTYRVGGLGFRCVKNG